MKTFFAVLAAAAVATGSASAFATPSNNNLHVARQPTTALKAEAVAAEGVPLANGKMSFDRVCRGWRCKYEGDKGTSESLEVFLGVCVDD